MAFYFQGHCAKKNGPQPGFFVTLELPDISIVSWVSSRRTHAVYRPKSPCTMRILH